MLRTNTETIEWKSTKPAKLDKHERGPTSVLIIDDDVDSALQVRSVFTHLGCQTTCALGWVEARKKLCALKYDIVILDWVLDQHVDAGNVVKLCTKTIEKFAGTENPQHYKKPRIVTYSSLLADEIHLVPSPYFEYFEHWQKPIPQRDLLGRALGLLGNLGK
jgi:PleD family two-component response regulator